MFRVLKLTEILKLILKKLLEALVSTRLMYLLVAGVQCYYIKYSFNASPGSIKSIETGGKYLFVSSYDESIRIYDARKFREIGLLVGHSSTILQMKNFKNMLYSSSDEGKILVWKHGDWALIKTFKENK